MEKLDKFLAVLSYSKRLLYQFKQTKNIKGFHLIFRGFLPNRAAYYDFENYSYENYVTDSHRFLKHTFINYKYKDLFRDKFANYIFLSQYTSKLVPIYAIVDNGKCDMVGEYASIDELFKVEKKFVLKPRKGFGGQGVRLLEIKENKYFVSGKEVESIAKIFEGLHNYILVPFVYQDEYANRINPDSLNTIRLLTCVFNDEVKVLGAFHRFGSNTTGNVDNFSLGGISAKINLQTGVIESAYCFDKKKYQKKKIEAHPDHNEPVVGLEIPKWHAMVEDVVNLHQKIKFIKYIGWDIAITADGYTIVESNDVTDVDSFQIHGPLLMNELSKSFYATVNN